MSSPDRRSDQPRLPEPDAGRLATCAGNPKTPSVLDFAAVKRGLMVEDMAEWGFRRGLVCFQRKRCTGTPPSVAGCGGTLRAREHPIGASRRAPRSVRGWVW